MIKEGHFKTFDFGTNLPGFFGAHVVVKTRSKVYFTWDETLVDGDVDLQTPDVLQCALAYTLAPGDYQLETLNRTDLNF